MINNLNKNIETKLDIKLTPQLEELLKKCREVRAMHFPNSIQFDYPAGTPAISLTGSDCDLNCAHCGGHYLKNMLDSEMALDVFSKNNYNSCLISGGCNHQGAVDTTNEIETIKAIKNSLNNKQLINMHVGMVEGEQLEQVAKLADVVSFDIVGDDQTIAEVYRTGHSAADYENCYKELKQRVTVIPHICIGLRGGQLGHEMKALQILQRQGAAAIVFIVFIPTKGTAYADCSPPDLSKTVELIAEARIMFPDIPIALGCMRPKGKYRAKLDYLAVLAGINRLVIPTGPAKQLVKTLDYQITIGEECCVL